MLHSKVMKRDKRSATGQLCRVVTGAATHSRGRVPVEHVGAAAVRLPGGEHLAPDGVRVLAGRQAPLPAPALQALPEAARQEGAGSSSFSSHPGSYPEQ